MTLRGKVCGFIWAAAAHLAWAAPAAAQCAMCRSTLENSAEAAQAASRMNLAVIVLLVPPVLIFSGIFALFYRHLRRPPRKARALEKRWT